MVISDEIKFPGPPVVEGKAKKRQVEEIDTIPPISPIKPDQRRWRKNQDEWVKRGDRVLIKGVSGTLPGRVAKTLSLLIEQVNRNFHAGNVDIHLALVKNENGYELDIHDCSNGQVCRLVRETEIHLDDLPKLLRNLQTESGILIDTVS